jgi:murein endopeptidase
VANKPSQSVGSPSSGKLVNGEKLPVGPGYIIRSPEYSYATNETITHLVNCIADVQRTFPGTHDAVIGHMSKKFGGKFRPHKSHSSGRDVDMGYYLKGMSPSKFIKVTPANFDVEKTMHFIQCLVDTKELEYIFVNYYIQKIMYAYMQKKGKEEPYLAKLIQYPKPVEKRVAFIRHDPGHDDHMHIRFQCPANSPACTE